MIKIGNARHSLMILFAIGLHYLWGMGLLVDDRSINTTSLAIFHNLFDFNPDGLAVALWAAGSLSLMSLLMPFGRFSIALMLPQQFMLMVSAYGAISAMVLGRFGDGVQRPVTFIVLDQSYAVMAAIFHTLAIIGRVGDAELD